MAEYPVSPGEVVRGKYRIERVLGTGGMGCVAAACQLNLGRLVALKFMLPRAMASAEGRERFQREARVAVKLRSEHVAHVLDFGVLDNGAPFIVMEYLEGQDLQQALYTRGSLPVAEAVGYVLQACEGLAEAHALGIVHRDLKPANLFVTRRPEGSSLVKVLDFGVSKVPLLGREAITTSQHLIGSPLYVAPEQVVSPHLVDARGDVWALGVILFHLLTGRPPFLSDKVSELRLQILERPAPSLTDAGRKLPPALAAAVGRCLEKRPRVRFSDVGELAAALAPFADRQEGEAAVARIARILG
jgi:eukaryotic-like serine/threonine-protein kinase